MASLPKSAESSKAWPWIFTVILLFCGAIGFAGYGLYEYCLKLEYIERSELPVTAGNRQDMLKGYSISDDSIKDVYYAHRVGFQVLDSYLRLDAAEGKIDMVARMLAEFFTKEGADGAMTTRELDPTWVPRVIEELAPLPWWRPETIKKGYCMETVNRELRIWVDQGSGRIYVHRCQ